MLLNIHSSSTHVCLCRQSALVEKIITGDIQSSLDYHWRRLGLSPDSKSFVASVLKTDPNVRLTLDEARAHPWFKLKLPEIDRKFRSRTRTAKEEPISGQASWTANETTASQSESQGPLRNELDSLPLLPPTRAVRASSAPAAESTLTASTSSNAEAGGNRRQGRAQSFYGKATLERQV
jgi:hypothetical protein